MRPRPSETIAGIRAILDETIAPELTSEHARARLSEIRSVLAAIDWDNIGFELVRRSCALAKALESPVRHIDAELPSPPSELVFAEYERYHDALATIAVDVLTDLRVRIGDNPHDEVADGELQQLLDCL